MKTYKTYQARNAVKAAQVPNHIIAAKKVGISHEDAKAEAYRIYKIKAAKPILKISFEEARILATQHKGLGDPLAPLDLTTR